MKSQRNTVVHNEQVGRCRRLAPACPGGPSSELPEPKAFSILNLIMPSVCKVSGKGSYQKQFNRL